VRGEKADLGEADIRAVWRVRRANLASRAESGSSPRLRGNLAISRKQTYTANILARMLFLRKAGILHLRFAVGGLIASGARTRNDYT